VAAAKEVASAAVKGISKGGKRRGHARGRGLYPILRLPRWGLPTQRSYWMASLKPFPARNPGVFDAGI